MSFDEPTRRLRPVRPEAPESLDAPTAPMPGPLDLSGRGTADPDAETGVLRLDELFDHTEPDRDRPPRLSAPAPVAADAPTWTAMPVVPVRSEPAAALPSPAARAPAAASRPRSDLAVRVRADALAAWQGTMRRSQAWWGQTHDWLRVQDNAVMAMTALVGILLIIVVAALGH